MLDKPIGGYFELELPPNGPGAYPGSLKFQSARAAFCALLQVGRPSRVWVPRYICDAMLSPLKVTGIDFSFYALEDDFSIDTNLQLGADEWLLYVNYFGACSYQQQRILQRFNPAQVVFDHAQAFFAPPLDCLATIYSPRKFFGLPDGGLMFTRLPLTQPSIVDEDSLQRSAHLLKRLAGTPESGYNEYQSAEATLEGVEPKGMSILTGRLFSSIDYALVKEKRNKNFQFLHNELADLNTLTFDIESIDGPLCYPMLPAAPVPHSDLAKQRIFVARYWPDVITRTAPDSRERLLTERLLPLCCDQRYEESDLLRMINAIKREL
ncbi:MULTISPECIES: hypothetical protein [unclassified Pseudomonas]|uniref:hypothetical protein n=1 Tax=unclassified Pseudomonas TaxID=196821 RepID=UPI0009F3A51F|nr:MULTISPECIES: hypothetical protein [unclassified Pseudomonas]QIH09983.1 hypothetical protein ATY02_26335 [Pseudomonas sp. BIOMIG1BAC]